MIWARPGTTLGGMAVASGRSLGTRLRALLIILLLSWAVLEVTAYLGLCYLDRDWAPYRRTQKIARGFLRDTAIAAGSRKGAPSWAEDKRVHPYLGSASLRLAEQLAALPEPREGELLVGLFGGSLAVQLAVEGESFFPQQLSAAYGRPVKLVNLANSGFKQPQQLLALTYLLSQGGKLDVAICLDGFNEVALYDEGDRGVHPSYPDAWKTRAGSALSPGMAIALAHRENVRAAIEATARRATSWLGHLPSAQLYVRSRLKLLSAQWDEAAREVEAVPVVASPAYEGDALPSLVKTWVTSTVQMDKLCRANGIAFFEFVQPNQYAPAGKPMGAEEARLALDPKQPVREGARRGYPLLLKAGAELSRHGVAHFDLTGIFGKISEPVYSDSCCHLNAQGLRILGDAIAARVKPVP